MQKLGNKYRHWVAWQAIPVVGWFVTIGIYIEFLKLLGRFTFGEHILTTFFRPVLFFVLGTFKKSKFYR